MFCRISSQSLDTICCFLVQFLSIFIEFMNFVLHQKSKVLTRIVAGQSSQELKDFFARCRFQIDDAYFTKNVGYTFKSFDAFCLRKVSNRIKFCLDKNFCRVISINELDSAFFFIFFGYFPKIPKMIFSLFSLIFS